MRIVASKPPYGYSAPRIALYVESSALVAAILENDVQMHELLARHARFVTSALTFAECCRAFLRARVAGRLTAAGEVTARQTLQSLFAQCVSLPVSQDILERTGRPFPVEPVRSLDAIHLASLEALGMRPEDLVVATRDRRVRENAEALGFTVA
jgi:predicted nucleic acid-binding protein